MQVLYLCVCSLSLQQVIGCSEDMALYFVHDNYGLNINTSQVGSTIILAPSLCTNSGDNAVFLIEKQQRGRISVQEQDVFGLHISSGLWLHVGGCYQSIYLLEESSCLEVLVCIIIQLKYFNVFRIMTAG
jgi:hypothetical protein